VIVLSRDLSRPDALEVARRLFRRRDHARHSDSAAGKGLDGDAQEAFDSGAAASLSTVAGEKDLVAHVRSLALRGGAVRPVGNEGHRQLLLDLARVMAVDRDPRAALHAAVRRVAEATGAIEAGVMLLSSGSKRALRAGHAPGGARRTKRVALADYPVLEHAAASGKLETDDDPADDPFSEKTSAAQSTHFRSASRAGAGLLVLRFAERVTPDSASIRLAELVALVAAAPLVTTREISRGGARQRARHRGAERALAPPRRASFSPAARRRSLRCRRARSSSG